jgi:hypothetical protein
MGKYRNHSNERPINDSQSPNSTSSSSSPSPTHENASSFPTEKDPILAFCNAEWEREDADPQTPHHVNPKIISAMKVLRASQFTVASLYSRTIGPNNGNLSVYMTVTLLLMISIVFSGFSESIRSRLVKMKPNYRSFAETFLLAGDVGLCAFWIYQMKAGRYASTIIFGALNAAMFLVTALYSLSFKITMRVPQAIRLPEDLGDLEAPDETYDE